MNISSISFTLCTHTIRSDNTEKYTSSGVLQVPFTAVKTINSDCACRRVNIMHLRGVDESFVSQVSTKLLKIIIILN